MAEPLRVALVGCGNSGRHYHLPLITADPRLDLRVVAAGHASSLEGLDLPGHVDRVVGWQDAVGRADVDLVVAALPHHLHHPVGRAALEGGAHVLLEKPMTTTTAEADDLLALAAARDRVLAVHHQRRWEHDVTTVLDVVASGEIGDPWRVVVVRGHQGHYVTATTDAPHAGDHVLGWTRERASGGGVARVIGPHPVDHLMAVAGSPVETVAGRVRREEGEDVDAWMGIDVTFASGAQGHVEIFRRTGVAPPRLTVWGTRGMTVATDGTRVEVRGHDGAHRVVEGLTPPGRHGQEVYDDVVAAVREGRPMRVDARHARDVVEVIELAERSAAAGSVPLAFGSAAGGRG